MRVRKGVFPVAGLGTRFLPATKAMPKEMLPIVDKPAIQYAVEEAVASDVEDVILITGRGKRAIEDHFDYSVELESILSGRGQEAELAVVRQVANLCRYSYIRQRHALGLGHAVQCAQQLVGDEPFAVLLADEIILSKTPGISQLLDVFEQSGGHPVVGVQKVPSDRVSEYGIVRVKSSNGRVHEVEDLVEKPRPGRAPSDLAVVGRYVLTPRVFDLLAKTTPGVQGKIQLTDALRGLAQEQRLLAVEIEGSRFDAGTKLGFLQATIATALARPDYGDDLRDWLRATLDLVSVDEKADPTPNR